MQRGEIWMVEIMPPAGEVRGREQDGDRPAVIVQYNPVNQATVVIVPITKTQDRTKLVGAFSIQPSPTNGLTVPSVVMTNQIRACDFNKFRRSIGKLEAQHLQRLEAEITALLDLR